MARTPTVTRDQVPEPLRAAFDAETAGSGGTIVSGPGSVMILSILQQVSRVRLVGLKRNDVGGVLLDAPSALCGSSMIARRVQ